MFSWVWFVFVSVKVKRLAAIEKASLKISTGQVFFKQMLPFSDYTATDLNPDLEGQLSPL